MGDCKKTASCPTGATGPTGPCCTGPTGPRGDPGPNTFLGSSSKELETDTPIVPMTLSTLLLLSVGTLTSPPRILSIWATISGSSSAFPNSVNAILRVDGMALSHGAEMTLTLSGRNQSLMLLRRVLVGAGIRTVALDVSATVAGASVQPNGRPQEDNATLYVQETAA